MVADQLHERVGELRAAAARDRHAALLHGDGDHLRHEARRRRVRAEAGVQHPRREQPVRALRRERLLEPVAARLQQLAGERGEARRARAGARAFAPSASPDGDQSSVPSTPNARSAFGKNRSSTPGHSGPSSAALPSAVRSRNAASPSGIRGRGRQLGVQVLEPARRELVAELRVRRAADPERMPRAEDVVVEPGLGQLRRVDRAAEPVVALEHADAPARAREQRAARERVDAAADDDRVVVSHPRAPGTRRR